MYQKALLIIVILVSSFLRLYKLGSVPAGMYVDETVVGYNAYSLALTGADEYGVKWPVFLKSFGVYPAPLYTYLTTIPVRLFGLNNFSVRLLSALSGISVVLLTFLIFRELKFKFVEPFVATTLVGFSPWMILMSRTGTEGQLSLFLGMMAVFFALRVEGHKFSWLGFFIFLGLASYAYQGARPVALGYFVLFSWWKFKNIKITWLMGLVIFVFILLPQLKLIGQPAFSQRGTGLFYLEAIENNAQKMTWPVAAIYEFTSQATSYFSPYSIFWKGDDDLQRSLPGISNFSAVFAIFYLIGWGGVLKKIKSNQLKALIVLGLSGVFVPVLTRDPFSSTRSQFLILPLVMIMTWGYSAIAIKIKNYRFFFGFFLFITLFSLIWVWRSMFVLLPYERAYIWDYGMEQLAREIDLRRDEKFLVEQKRNQPVYIQLLYYMKYPPELYQATQTTDGYYSDIEAPLTRSFGNIRVQDIEWKKDIYIDQILVGDELSISEGQAKEHFLEKVFEIKDPLGKVLFVGYRTNPSKKKVSEKIMLLKKTF